MTDVVPFINLAKDGESDLRLKSVGSKLPPGATLKPGAYGGGDFANYGKIATKLFKDNPNAIFLASCWPTLNALNNASVSPSQLVYAGMVTSSAPPFGSSGITAFEINDLCSNWPDLLQQIAPGMTKAAIVYDHISGAPKDQCTAIKGNAGKITFIPIYADDNSNPPKPNLNIDNDIKNAPLAKGDGLIVTACTLTGLLRDKITQAARKKQLVTICPERMYMARTAPANSCLMTYGPNLLGLYAQAASTIIKDVIAGGTKIIKNGDYELLVNTVVAAELGVKIPVSFNVTVGGKTITIKPTPYP
ncbi:MAG TPA: hypothetical protein VH684_28035 [Xanthobacteraceae bacterium]|jgi:hypothetical protein